MKNNYALISLVIFFLILLAIIGYGFSLNSKTGEFLFTTLSLSLASLLVGLLFGFIFGFPHEQYDSIDHKNSPMKEITDWLSKIIVGLGLVEMKSISIEFNNLILSLQQKLNTPPSSEIIIGASLVFFLIAGFILSYFLTVTGTIFYAIMHPWDKFKKKDFLNKYAQTLDSYPEEVNTNEKAPEVHVENIEDLKVKINEVLDLDIQLPIETMKKYAKVFYGNNEYLIAARLFKKIYEKDNKELYHLLNSAYIYSSKLNQHSQSISLLKNLISRQPKFAEAHYNLACSYIRSGDKEEALQAFTKAIKLKPELCEAARLDSALNEIREQIDAICVNNIG